MWKKKEALKNYTFAICHQQSKTHTHTAKHYCFNNFNTVFSYLGAGFDFLEGSGTIAIR
jgi:hypothetical protein